MSTKAKIGKDWVKCQVKLAETGETLHLTFAPGETKKKIVAIIDGRTDVGFIELTGVTNAQPPHDAELRWSFKGEGVRTNKPAPVAEAKPLPPPKPVAVVTASKPPTEEASATLPPPPEEIVIPVVQEPASDITSGTGGRRGRKPTVQLPE